MILGIETDHNRFKQIVRGKIKQNLKKYIVQGELIGKKGKDLVSIPVPQIEIPTFRFGDKEVGGVGQGDGDVGTPVGSGDNEEGSGGAGNQPGAHILEVEVSLEELAQMLGEELELPRIEPRGKKNIQSIKDKYTGISRVGPESLRHFKRTYKEALKRQIASGTYNNENPIIIPIREDKRYRSWKSEVSVESNAVIIYMMDVSGCHTEGHFVEMADGSYKDVKDIKIGDKVCCVDILEQTKTTSFVTETFKYEVDETLSIVTEDHVELRVTPNHRYFIYDEMLNLIIEKQASEIKKGDLLILVNKHGSETAGSYELSDAEAYLVGVLLGDGHIVNTPNCKYIAITDENVDRLKLYKSFVLETYGIDGIIKQGDRNRLHINSAELVRNYRNRFPMLFNRSRQRMIDPIIFQQAPPLRASFLQGLFDAEGTISQHSVELISSSLNLIKQVKLLLSYWGIRARVNRKYQQERKIKGNIIKGNYYYVLSINAKDTITFYQTIGFRSREKQEKLTKLAERQKSMLNAMRNRYVASFDLKKEFDFVPSIEKIKSRLYETGRFAFSESNIRRLQNVDTITESEYNLLNSILENGFVVSKVKSVIYRKEPVTVYDFEVADYHNYIIDGVLSHNSMWDEQKEIVRIETFWIDTWLRSQYKGLDTRYIVHDAAAKEVDRETFFHLREGGGTVISSAYKLALDIVKADYNPAEWNIYLFHFSDGDNWSRDDTRFCLELLEKEIIPVSNLFCYGQVESPYGSGQFLRDIEDKFRYEEKVSTSLIQDKDEILDSIKQFLGKGK